MRKLLFTAVAAAAIASPAMARDGQPYVGIEAGALFARNMNFSYFDGFATTNNYLIVDHKTGIDADIIAGYDFGPIRAEIEGGYKSASHKDYTFQNRGGLATTEAASGRTRVYSIMGNLLGDFGNQDGLSFYAGGGVGYASTKVRIRDIQSTTNLRDSHLAWQLIAGVRYAITPNIDLGVKYRYFNTKFRDTDLFNTNDRVHSKFRSHSLLASLIYNFAPPPPVMVAPPPPPPPPPAPEPVQNQTCYDGSVIPVTSMCPSPPPPPPPPPPVPTPGERG